jgi:hypothetical protein
MKAANPWITYRTRFLVNAKQLTAALSFTDSLGRQHSGSKGDYLVESSDGILSIAARQIFEDIYVPLLSDETPTAAIVLPTEISSPFKPPQPSMSKSLKTAPALAPSKTLNECTAPFPGTSSTRFGASPQPIASYLGAVSAVPQRPKNRPDLQPLSHASTFMNAT